jgi:peptidylprolyl isomerase
MSKAINGNTVRVHYKGTFNDGTVFDSSYDRGQTIDFEVGSGMMIPGFDQAVNGMTVGEVKNVTITSAQAYGEPDPSAFTEVPKDSFPEDFPLLEGVTVQGTGQTGQPLIGTIDKVNEDHVVLNLNHPMAGKDLNFEIELVGINVLDINDTDTNDTDTNDTDTNDTGINDTGINDTDTDDND